MHRSTFGDSCERGIRRFLRDVGAPWAKRVGVVMLAGCLGGCTLTHLDVRLLSQAVDVRLDPATNRLEATSVIELEVVPADGERSRRSVVEFELHPDLAVESVTAEGATIAKRRTIPSGDGESEGFAPATLRLVVENPASTVRLSIAYRGELSQDVAAGEVKGQVHNFSVRAHIGEDGIYLEPDGYWYPRLELPRGTDTGGLLADYELVTDAIDGFELVAGLEAVGSGNREGDGRLRWKSPFPLDGLVLLGGPLQRHTRVHEGITVHAVVAPGKDSVADDILAAAVGYLDRYQPLIGAYPYREFTVLEAFFSSGFAFPTCTQIAGSQLSEHQQYRRHGYLDHELLHNWWGNGIFVDPDDGNWCEGLATYMANYAGYVLDGDEEGARKQRRNYSNFLSAIDPEDDKPLGTFGLAGGAGRGIGYQKGAAVFHMLERKIGPDALLAGLRLLTEEQMGRHIGWNTIREAMERASGRDLSTFFVDWVRGSGAPLLQMTAAEWRPEAGHVLVTLDQGGTEFELDVPLRLHYEDRKVDLVVTIDGPRQQVEVPLESEGLRGIELDPDYHLFRKLQPDQIMPTSALTRRAERLVIVVPDGEVAGPYREVADSFRNAVLGDDDGAKSGREVIERTASTINAETLSDASILVLGEAVQSTLVQDLLGRSRSPVRWGRSSFQVHGNEYPAPGQAVFFTVHHPDRAELGVTVYYGNSEQALSNARVLSYYPNSLLVFETSASREEAADGEETLRARPVERIDFEFHDRIEF